VDVGTEIFELNVEGDHAAAKHAGRGEEWQQLLKERKKYSKISINVRGQELRQNLCSGERVAGRERGARIVLMDMGKRLATQKAMLIGSPPIGPRVPTPGSGRNPGRRSGPGEAIWQKPIGGKIMSVGGEIGVILAS